MRASATVVSLVLVFFGGLVLLAGLRSASAAQFSADFVTTSRGRPAPVGVGKLYVGDRVVRIETPDLKNGRFLVDLDAPAAFFVMPAQRVFMDAKQSSRLTQILVPVDPDDPCRAWQAMAKIAGAADLGARWRCERLGADAVGGAADLKYRATSPRGEVEYVWIDPRLRFPLKFQFADGSGVALDNIREAVQPAALFAIPAGYHKFDPQRLIERIKQSDVWVDPPK